MTNVLTFYVQEADIVMNSLPWKTKRVGNVAGSTGNTTHFKYTLFKMDDFYNPLKSEITVLCFRRMKWAAT